MHELSVVIPTYDTAAMTLRCCRAVLAALPEPAEVIVVDDGSRDGTAELLPREVRVLRLEENRGFAVAANRGVASADGAIVLLLNSDAIVDANALRALLAAFANDPRLGIAGARLLDEDGTQQWSGGRTPTLAWIAGVVSGAGHLARMFRRRGAAPARDVDWVSGAAMAFRREVWNAVGPLSEQFLFYCQDLDFCLRARDRGWRVRIVDEARVTHAMGATIAAREELRHKPELLWRDLLAWGRGRYGRAWYALARIVLIPIAWLRVAWSALRRSGSTAALKRAATALRRT
ncbi:MAG TPA: glycosyltransferase family 2 protein [Thermoanaerobaculia bacterium]|nr:glycosyltransferase family 2 protein [Thermoanaerobaculia bacterium]